MLLRGYSVGWMWGTNLIHSFVHSFILSLYLWLEILFIQRPGRRMTSHTNLLYAFPDTYWAGTSWCLPKPIYALRT